MPHIVAAAILALAMQNPTPMEPNCGGRPVTQAELGRLFDANLKEEEVLRHLVACGMGPDLTPESKVLTQLKLSKDFSGTLEWLHKWETMGTQDATVLTKVEMDVTGAWTATFADSKMNGTLHVNLVQSPGGTVRGTYSSSLGGGGQLFGTVWAKEAKVALRQNVEGCPGITKAVLHKTAESLTGEYIGYDCAGVHLNGRFTLTPGIVLPSSGEANKPVIVFGSELELRLGTTVHVIAEDASINEKAVIEHVLNSKGIAIHDDPVKADFLLTYGTHEGKPFLAAQRLILLHNTFRVVWVCTEYPENVGAVGAAEHCARQFASAYAEAHAR